MCPHYPHIESCRVYDNLDTLLPVDIESDVWIFQVSFPYTMLYNLNNDTCVYHYSLLFRPEILNRNLFKSLRERPNVGGRSCKVGKQKHCASVQHYPHSNLGQDHCVDHCLGHESH